MSSHEDAFPDDLSGHFWARVVEMPDVDRWRYEVVDYQNNVVAQGVAVSRAQAARFVQAWDAVAGRDFPGSGDPSLPWPEDLR
jgi:hypothetical protein